MSDKPATLPVIAGAIPIELRAGRPFVTWRWVQRDGKWTKPPYTTAGKPASVDDPATWTDFESAIAAYRNGHDFAGIGRVLLQEDGYTGIDLDKCRDPATGAIDVWALAVVQRFNSYTEVSPSGTGLRIFLRGTLPPGRRRKGPIEMYDGGRYLTLTGHHLPGTPATVEERTDELAAWHAELFAKPAAPPPTPVVPPTAPQTDDELIARAAAAANGAAFARLWSGDTTGYDGDHSAADFALLNYLAYWTGSDRQRMDRLFRRSGLMRSKWDERRGESTYGGQSIERVLEDFQPAHLRRRAAGTDRSSGDVPAKPRTLADVIATFQTWLYLPDPGIVYAVLATVAANYAEEDPLWLMVIGASSGGKTEVLNAIAGLPHVHQAATMTEGSLLSGTPKRDAKGAKGGLLREIGDFGIVVCKDFTSVLSMNRDTRAAVLAALREVYDGAWTRHVGTDGGRTLHWAGKIGLIAGCTAAWDSHHAVIGAMGERFLSFRLPEMTEAGRHNQARKALANRRGERAMREALAGAVRGLFDGIDTESGPEPMTEDEIDRLVSLGSLVTRCRSAVDRDSYSRDISLILDTEAPARLTAGLGRLYGGLRMIGLPPEAAWPVVIRCGLDSLPKVRRDAFNALAGVDDLDTTTVAARTGYPTVTIRRALEDLTAHHAVERIPGGPGKADSWRLTPEIRADWDALTVPEMSGGAESDTATVPEMSGGNGSGTAVGNSFNTPNTTMNDFSEKVPRPVPYRGPSVPRASGCTAPGCGNLASARADGRCWGCAVEATP